MEEEEEGVMMNDMIIDNIIKGSKKDIIYIIKDFNLFKKK